MICRTCNINKEKECFYYNKAKQKYETECKECAKKRAKEYRKNNKEKKKKADKKYRENNKEKISKQRKEYRENNKEKVAKGKKKYYEDNKEKILKKKKEYRENNKDKIKDKKRKYYQKNKAYIKSKSKRNYEKAKRENPEKLKEQKRNYERNKRQNNIEHKLLCNLRRRINNFIKGKDKSATTIDLLGCTTKQLKEHLESQFQPGMTWENYGISGWHIDHVIPCSFFDLTKPEHQKKCFHYSNLQPLWAKDNLRKGNKFLNNLKKRLFRG